MLYMAAAFWPSYYGKSFVKSNKSLVLTWVMSCSMMSTFTFLPVIKIESTNLM